MWTHAESLFVLGLLTVAFGPLLIWGRRKNGRE